MAQTNIRSMASTPDKVAGEAKRRNRKRTTGATRLRQINAKARERQEAWAEGGQPNRTARLTGDLTALYRDLRRDRREAYVAGEAVEGDAYRGSTSGGRG